MRFTRMLLVLLGLLVASRADAQKRCKKGIPCGNTCISAAKTCHVGTASAPETRAERPDLSVAAVSDSAGAWVASSRGHTYYVNGCKAAAKLSPVNRIYFKSEEAAQKAGYNRSRSRGC